MNLREMELNWEYLFRSYENYSTTFLITCPPTVLPGWVNIVNTYYNVIISYE